MSRRIADVLPVQDHYYLLSDGTRFAKHGTETCNGIVVFTNLERAEQFQMTVGKGLNFEPCKVTAGRFLAEAEKVGAFCLAEGLRVTVCQIAKTNDSTGTEK